MIKLNNIVPKQMKNRPRC